MGKAASLSRPRRGPQPYFFRILPQNGFLPNPLALSPDLLRFGTSGGRWYCADVSVLGQISGNTRCQLLRGTSQQIRCRSNFATLYRNDMRILKLPTRIVRIFQYAFAVVTT